VVRASCSTLTGSPARSGSALAYTTSSRATAAVVVDRQRDQARLQAPGADRVGELAGVLPDDAHGHLRVAPREVLDEPREQQVVGGAERSQRRRAAGQRAGAPHRVGGLAGGAQRALGLGHEQAAGVGELQPAPRPHEQRDPELGLQVRDLLGDARPGEVQHVGRGGEGAVLGRGEEVGQLLQRHVPVGNAYAKGSQSALAHRRVRPDTAGDGLLRDRCGSRGARRAPGAA
jgi:hypothetical protein